MSDPRKVRLPGWMNKNPQPGNLPVGNTTALSDNPTPVAPTTSPTNVTPPLQILSNTVKALTGQLQLLDETHGNLVQDVTRISDRIPHLDDFSRYRKRIRALEDEVDRICGQFQFVEHLEQSVHDLPVGLYNVSNQQRVYTAIRQHALPKMRQMFRSRVFTTGF